MAAIVSAILDPDKPTPNRRRVELLNAYAARVTVIAFAENFGYPVLFGDILVTARDSLAEAPPALPTAPEGVGVEGFPKVKLRKKLYIINDCLAVGLTGELTALARFLQVLRARFPLSATHSEIEDFLADYDQPPNGDLGALLVLAELGEERTAFRVFARAASEAEASTEFAGEL
jgi:hypothetical protein